MFTKINGEISKKERELLAITNPEVKRLKDIEEEAKQIAIKKEREMILPYRIEELSKIGNNTDKETLLSMDNAQFADYLIAKTQEKKYADAQIALEKEREEQRKLDIKEAEDKARIETEERMRKEIADEKIEKHIAQLVFNNLGTSYKINRVVKVYDNDYIYLLKPKELRYWLKSIALRDADETIIDLYKAGY